MDRAPDRSSSLPPPAHSWNPPVVSRRTVAPRSPADQAGRDRPALARFDARSAIAVTGQDGRLAALRQQSPMRYLRPVPDPGEPPTVVQVNTAGGIVGGDRLDQRIGATDGASVLVIPQAAEKIYRSDGATATVTTEFSAAGGAQLEVLPQGTILFDGARLSRRTALHLDEASTLMFGELLHFGRRAMGERYRRGFIDDRIMLWRSGRLVLADALRIDDETVTAMAAPAGLRGADTGAVLWLAVSDAGAQLGPVRTLLASHAAPEVLSAAAVFPGGPLVVRWLGRNGAAVRHSFGATWQYLRHAVLGRPRQMPRIWTR